MIGQVHLGRRKSTHTAQRLPAENGCKIVPPGLNVEFDIGHGSGRDNGVAPHRSEPFDTGPVAIVVNDGHEVVKDIAAAHLAQSEKQLTGVVEHHPRATSGIHEIANEVRGATVAPREGRGIMHAVNVPALDHVLQVADHWCCVDIPILQNEWLMHVQAEGKCRLDALQIERRPFKKDRSVVTAYIFHVAFRPGDVRQIVNDLGNRL